MENKFIKEFFKCLKKECSNAKDVSEKGMGIFQILDNDNCFTISIDRGGSDSFYYVNLDGGSGMMVTGQFWKTYKTGGELFKYVFEQYIKPIYTLDSKGKKE